MIAKEDKQGKRGIQGERMCSIIFCILDKTLRPQILCHLEPYISRIATAAIAI